MSQPFEPTGAVPAAGQPLYPAEPVEPVRPGPIDDPSMKDVAKDEAAGVAGTAKENAGHVADTAKQGAADVAGTAKAGAAGVADTAKAGAANVADTAKVGAGQVAETAKGEARQVADLAGRHAQGLFDQARDEFTGQVSSQQTRLAETLRTLGSDLGRMASGEQPEPGLAQDLAQQASGRLDEVSRWLDQRGPADLLDEVRTFARRRPGMFLGLAALTGLVAGRLTRGLADDARAGEAQADTYRRPVGPAYPTPPGEPLSAYPYEGGPRPGYGDPTVAQPPYGVQPAYGEPGYRQPAYTGQEGQFGGAGETPGTVWAPPAAPQNPNEGGR